MKFITFPQVTSDKVRIAVFGGLFIGLGIRLVIWRGGVIDGLEIIAHYTNKKFGFPPVKLLWLLIPYSLLGSL